MRVVACLLVLMLAGGTGLEAQGSRYEGYWGNLGLGGGARVIVFEGATEVTGGGAGTVRMGGKLSDRVLLGGELGGWGWEEDGIFLVRGNWTVTGVFFPSSGLGLLVKGGIGGATARAVETRTTGTPRSIARFGVGASVGIGYDIPFGRSASLTPGIDFLYQWIEDQDVQKAGLLLFTIGVTWH